MKKPKLKLQPFEIKNETELSAKFLSKILGGGELDNLKVCPGDQSSNAPNYSISVLTNCEVETSKEKD